MRVISHYSITSVRRLDTFTIFSRKIAKNEKVETSLTFGHARESRLSRKQRVYPARIPFWFSRLSQGLSSEWTRAFFHHETEVFNQVKKLLTLLINITGIFQTIFSAWGLDRSLRSILITDGQMLSKQTRYISWISSFEFRSEYFMILSAFSPRSILSLSFVYKTPFKQAEKQR